MKTKRNYHVGGEQLLLILPPSDWKRPAQLPDLRHHKRVALDLECRDGGLAQRRGPGWTTGDGYVCGAALAWREGDELRRGYFPLRHPDSDCFDPKVFAAWLQQHRHVRFVCHGAPYDVGWVWRDFNVELEHVDDSACMAYMVQETRLNYSLNHVCRWLGVQGKDEDKLREAAAAFGFDPKSEMWKLPARYVGQYAEQDAASALLCAEKLDWSIDEEELRKAYQLEMDLLPMVHHMTRRGVRIDVDQAERLRAKYKKQSSDALQQLSEHVGQKVGIDELRSSAWLKRVFDNEKISYPHTAKTGQASFQAKWMKDVDHWLPQLVIRAKNREEAAEKFIKGYILDFLHDGRLHPSINQYRGENLYDEESRGSGTRTYRFSYSDPPLQQIPQRDEEMSEIRSCFAPERDEEWLSEDASQQEYRLMVHFAALPRRRWPNGLPKAAEAVAMYTNDPDTDFHSMVAGMTGLKRKPAKDANFAKIYGAGIAKFAFMINKSVDEAQAIMTLYDQKLPFAKMLFEECKTLAEQRGYIRLLDGARIRFDYWVAIWRPEGTVWTKSNHMADCSREEAEKHVADPAHPWYRKTLRRSRGNKAMNGLVQGSAARQIKMAMRACWREKFIPLLQIHDELCFSIADPAHSQRINELMCNAVPGLLVPMKVDGKCGASWHAGKA